MGHRFRVRRVGLLYWVLILGLDQTYVEVNDEPASFVDMAFLIFDNREAASLDFHGR